MEFAERGELYTLIQKRKSQYKLWSEDEIMNYFVQIALAVNHIHEKSVLHRDLKSKNIFVTKEGLLKVGDFGIAKVLNSSSDVAKTAIGTPYYLSPEICEDKPYNQKSDVWALGCVLYELTTLNHAFDGQSLPALVLKILSGKYPAISSRYSPKLKKLIDSMFRRNPKSRPSVAQMLSQPYVKEYVDKYLDKIAKKGLVPGKVTATAAAASHCKEEEAKQHLEINHTKGNDRVEDAAQAPTPAQKGRANENWFQQQEAALKEIGQALNFQKANVGEQTVSDRRKPRPAAVPNRRQENGNPARNNAKKPIPVVRAVPPKRFSEPIAQPVLRSYSRNSAPMQRRDPVERKWSKKAFLNAQREKDERFRLKAAEEARKAAKSEALHAEFKANKEAKLKKAAEIKEHMAKHKSGLKKVRPRLSKDMLKAAGAAFAERQKERIAAPDQQADCGVLLPKRAPPQKISHEPQNFVVEKEERVSGMRDGQEHESEDMDKTFPVVEIFVPSKSKTPGQKIHKYRGEGTKPKPLQRKSNALEKEGSFRSNAPCTAVHANSKSSSKGGDVDDIGQRIESLRVTLEDNIGEEQFIAVYKYLRKIGQTDNDPQMETQAKLENILGSNGIQYAFLIHKLLMLEDSLY